MEVKTAEGIAAVIQQYATNQNVKQKEKRNILNKRLPPQTAWGSKRWYNGLYPTEVCCLCVFGSVSCLCTETLVLWSSLADLERSLPLPCPLPFIYFLPTTWLNCKAVLDRLWSRFMENNCKNRKRDTHPITLPR